MGITPAEIANSLVFAADAGDGTSPVPLLVLSSGGHRVDTIKIADTLECAPLRQATPEEVRAWTGFAIGGVAPVGSPHPTAHRRRRQPGPVYRGLGGRRPLPLGLRDDLRRPTDDDSRHSGRGRLTGRVPAAGVCLGRLAQTSDMSEANPRLRCTSGVAVDRFIVMKCSPGAPSPSIR